MSTETTQPSYKHLTAPDYGVPKQSQHAPLQGLTRPHIDSFNFLLQHGLSRAVKSSPPLEFVLPNGDRILLKVLEATISNPRVPDTNSYASTRLIYPAECRERGVTYKGALHIQMLWRVMGGAQGEIKKEIGQIPIMVKSDLCNIKDMSPAELVRKGEEQQEMGGYFIINGNEKVIRLLIMPRRNSPTCVIRPSWKNRGKQYTDYGVSMRCVRPDQTFATNILHYLSNGTATLSFTHQKEMFFIPVMFVLKGLMTVTDKYIYNELVRGKEDDTFYKGCVVFMLRQALSEGLTSRKKVLQYIGQRFRIKLSLPDWHTDVEVGEFLFKNSICVHLDNNVDKFNLLIYMTRKLFCFARGECAAESGDNTMNQELLLPGHLFIMFLKEKIEGWLVGLKAVIDRNAKAKQRAGSTFKLDESTLSNAIRYAGLITRSVEYLLATGNLVSKSGLGVMQTSGLTVIADKLNFYRYISHFRSVHRGAFFAEMRTTGVRKMLAESWGFICPVHTPDGTPCGLLNHMTAQCQVVNTLYNASQIPRVLCSLGMTPVGAPVVGDVKDLYTVLLDGRVLGSLESAIVKEVSDKLRVMKVQGQNKVPPVTEICFVPRTDYASQYPGLYIFTTPTRMMRPVQNLALDKIEMIGTFEQVYMDICITPEEAHEGTTMYQELSQITMLSAIACLTPFSDFNQSPRNIYQCQMGKQTMGTPCHALSHRSDTKLYRIQTPQCSMVRPYMHDHYNIDEYPLGTNAVVAVISYTGYDMEDAMILNKSSFERGFGHGTIHKCEFVNLRDVAESDNNTVLVFGIKSGDKKLEGKLDSDGLPPVGTFLQEGDPFYSYINLQTGETRVKKYMSAEPAYVDSVKVLGDEAGKQLFQNVCIGLRIKRNPIIGDKFASRHGQKGICSMMWPVENMPFTESGMTPDILFNPHGYPSRMTIGMMIESMAGKSAASHGLCHDATPFTFSEDQPAIDYFGKMLRGAGYNYYGTERMYSGVDGRELEADIFVGVVYYQRLRHMVSDKFQVRSTGPVDQVTHQPVKGRRRGGGIRFGEMERDAMIAHGTAFLLQDRLLNCSDRSMAHVCSKCGSILSPVLERPPDAVAAVASEAQRKWTCTVCNRSDTVTIISVPYVFRYLVAELAAMSIKVELEIK